MELQVLQEVTLHQQVKEDKDSINRTMNKWRIIIKKTKNKKKKREHKMDKTVKKEANKNNKMMMHKMMDNQMKINDILY